MDNNELYRVIVHKTLFAVNINYWYNSKLTISAYFQNYSEYFLTQERHSCGVSENLVFNLPCDRVKWMKM